MMLSESDQIDQVNPYVVNPPGAWSNPYPFAGYLRLVEEPEEKQDPSPACELMTTAGDKQVSWCKPGTPNCPMERELEPTQKVEPDISYEARGDISFGTDLGVVNTFVGKLPHKIDTQFIINFIILLIFIILLVKMMERF
jgi:hypothetical protein